MGLTLNHMHNPANFFQSPPTIEPSSDLRETKKPNQLGKFTQVNAASKTKPTMTRDETLRPEHFAATVSRKRADVEIRSKHPAAKGGISASIPSSYVSQTVLKSRFNPSTSNPNDNTDTDEEDARAASLPIAEQLAEQALAQGKAVTAKHPGRRIEIPSTFTEFLDGTHHSDEICVHFHWSWNILYEMLVVVGGGSGEDGDLGRVVILLR
jgi:hypothetical protein